MSSTSAYRRCGPRKGARDLTRYPLDYARTPSSRSSSAPTSATRSASILRTASPMVLPHCTSTGLPHTVENAGGQVGINPNTTALPGDTISYTIEIPEDPTAERAYYFRDHGASRQRVVRGLFGALVAEPAGSIHYDVETGEVLTSNNWEAIIAPPSGPAFREFVIMYHEVGDENFDGILDVKRAQPSGHRPDYGDLSPLFPRHQLPQRVLSQPPCAQEGQVTGIRLLYVRRSGHSHSAVLSRRAHEDAPHARRQ